MTPKDELKQLLERVAEMCLDNVDKYGWHIPVCLAHSHSGERIYVVADDPEKTDQDAYDYPGSVRSISHQVRKYIDEGKFRAIALAVNTTSTLVEEGKRFQAKTVKIMLDHEAGGGYTAYLTYDMEEGKSVPGQIIYQELAERFFSEKE
ncbi:MAG TPA: hypothetical protein VKE98_13130 [Gemmataceae bacterium]|nr:hypothetical protein [Gemmataceae bacterium]